VLASHTLDRGAATVPASWLLRGTSPNPFGPTVAGDAQSARHRSGRGPLRIVNFVGLSGSAGIWGPASMNCTMLAVSEINRRGGILGREVEVEFRDAGRRTSDVVEDAADIVADGSADIIVGSHISAVRLELRKVIAGRIPSRDDRRTRAISHSVGARKRRRERRLLRRARHREPSAG
jgi:urea transport system substrate-binding protein